MRKALFVLAVFFSGCANEVVTSNPRSVTIHSGDGSLAAAQAMADAECKKHDRYARLVMQSDSRFNVKYTFDCAQ